MNLLNLIVLIIVAYIIFNIYLSDKSWFNFEPAFAVVQYKQKKQKPKSRTDIFSFGLPEVMYWINEFMTGKPNTGLMSANHLPFNFRLNLLIRMFQNRIFDVWNYNSFKAHEGWHIRNWNTFRPLNRIKSDINYHKGNLPDSGHKRLIRIPFLKNTHSFTEKHCFDANRQIWGNNSYIARRGFWLSDQVYKDPALKKNNDFVRTVKQTCDSYITDYQQSNSRSNTLFDRIHQENKALKTLKSLRIGKVRARADIDIEELRKEIEKYEKQISFINNPENFNGNPFSNWRDYVFDSYETNFYEIERKQAALLLERIDSHFDLNTDSWYVQQGILKDIRNTEKNLLRELLRKPFF